MLRTWMAATALLFSPALAWADDAPQASQQITVVVGGSTLLRLPSPVSAGVCDDTSLVKIEDAGDALRIVGLKAGKTLCGFWGNPRTGRRTLVEVIVTPKKADPAR